jgi:glycosyltransferase involved in cell wall biosynthesis
VSVAITTHNSEKWLEQALDSVLEQETGFPIEVIIADDCSQDETVDIARSYQKRYPGLITVVARPVNIGIQRNYFDTFERCRGKYIAWLDADDYWTDPRKLAIQVTALESDPSINVCCHYVRWVTKDGQINRDKAPSLPPGRYGLEEVLRQNFVATPSVMFRAGIQRSLPEWYFDLAPITDWPIWIMAALSGSILLIDCVMADYMLTPGSAFAGKGVVFGSSMEAKFYDHVESILPPRWHRLARSEKGKRYETLSYLLRKQGEYTESRRAAVKAFRSPALLDNLGGKTTSLLAAVMRETQWRFRGRRTAANQSSH